MFLSFVIVWQWPQHIYNLIRVNSNKDKTVSIHAVLKNYMETFSIKSKVAEFTQWANDLFINIIQIYNWIYFIHNFVILTDNYTVLTYYKFVYNCLKSPKIS